MRREIRTIAAAIFILTVVEAGLGQNCHVSGYVIENDVRKPGVKIMVVGAQDQATDKDGNFRIVLPNEHFQPGKPLTIRVNGWKVFDPIFGQGTARDLAFNAPVIVSIVRPGSALAHQDRKRLGAIVEAFEKENNNLSQAVTNFQQTLDATQTSLQALVAENNRLKFEAAKYAFLKKYSAEYEIPLQVIESALDDWARNKNADDDLDAARRAFWRGDYKQVEELTRRAADNKEILAARNREEALKLGRDLIDTYRLRMSAFGAQSDFRGAYNAARQLDGLFENRRIAKEDFLEEWADTRVGLGGYALFLQLQLDSENSTAQVGTRTELANESLAALKSTESYYSMERSVSGWAVLKIFLALNSAYAGGSASLTALTELMTSLEEVLNASNKDGKVFTPEKYPVEWSLVQYLRAIGFVRMSSFVSGEESLSLLRKAIKTHRDLLNTGGGGNKIFTLQRFPDQWRNANEGLASALADLSRKIPTAEGLTYLNEAIEIYRSLLTGTTASSKVYDPEKKPNEWLAVRASLASALLDLSGRQPAPENLNPLRGAIALYKETLTTQFGPYAAFGWGIRVLSPQRNRQEWLDTQNFLAILLTNLGSKVTGPESVNAYKEAAAVYRELLTAKSDNVAVLSPDKSPQQWAATQNLLSVTLVETSRRTTAPENMVHLKEALAAIELVLEATNNGKKIITPDKYAIEWGSAKNNLGNILLESALKTPGAAGDTDIANAIAAHKEVLTTESGGAKVFVPEKFIVIWLAAQNGLALASTEANRRNGSATDNTFLTDAIAAYKAILSLTIGGTRIFSPRNDAQQWMLTHSSLAAALITLNNQTRDQSAAAELVRISDDVLAAQSDGGKELSPEKTPQAWAVTQIWLSSALVELSRRTTGAVSLSHLNRAIKANRLVLNATVNGTRVITPETYSEEWINAQNSLGQNLFELAAKTPGPAGITHLKDAIAAFKLVLTAESQGKRILVPETFFFAWLVAQRGVGLASVEADLRIGNTADLTRLNEAIEAYKAVLSASVAGVTVLTPEGFPRDWIFTRNALASALFTHSRSITDAKNIYLDEAVELYRESLAAKLADVRIYSPETFPLEWAASQNGLSWTLTARNRISGAEDSKDLREAITLAKEVLQSGSPEKRIYTPSTFSAGWLWAQIALGTALGDLSFWSSATERITHADAAIETAKTILEATSEGSKLVTPENTPHEWINAKLILAAGYNAREEWTKERDVYVEILRHFPNDQTTYRLLNIVYVNRLFLFDLSLDLNQRRLAAHPADREARINHATSLLRVGRFKESVKLIEAVLKKSELSANEKIGMMAIEIVGLTALNQPEKATALLEDLIRTVSLQDASFKLAWSFEGTKHFIDSDKKLKPHHAWLNQLLDAFRSKDRDSLVEALKMTQTSLRPGAVFTHAPRASAAAQRAQMIASYSL